MSEQEVDMIIQYAMDNQGEFQKFREANPDLQGFAIFESFYNLQNTPAPQDKAPVQTTQSTDSRGGTTTTSTRAITQEDDAEVNAYIEANKEAYNSWLKTRPANPPTNRLDNITNRRLFFMQHSLRNEISDRRTKDIISAVSQKY